MLLQRSFKLFYVATGRKANVRIERIEVKNIVVITERRLRSVVAVCAPACFTFDGFRRYIALSDRRRLRRNVPQRPMVKSARKRRIRIMHDNREAFCTVRHSANFERRDTVRLAFCKLLGHFFAVGKARACQFHTTPLGKRFNFAFT